MKWLIQVWRGLRPLAKWAVTALGVIGSIASIIGVVPLAQSLFSPAPTRDGAGSIESDPSSEPIPVRVPIREESADELLRSIYSRPPLQRPSIESEYIGRYVAWRGQLFNIKEEDQGLLVFIVDPHAVHKVTGVKFNHSWRHQLEVFREGDFLAYEGTIAAFRGAAVAIDGTRIERIHDSE